MGAHLRIAATVAVLVLGVACRRDEEKPLVKNAPPPVATDRLLPGEELPGRPRVFGIEVPEGMRVSARFAKLVQLQGQVQHEAVANYFKTKVVTDRVELSKDRAIFPAATIPGDEEKRVFRIEIVSDHGTTSVRMRDVTPPPVEQGLSEKERWERAGFNADGSQKDRLKTY